MIVYAETSAVLRWLLGGSKDGAIRSCLGGAERVVTSRLTLAEVRRVLLRAVVTKTLGAAQAAQARAAFGVELPSWDIVEITEEVWLRAEQRFPVEPVRTLDALHLATALQIGDVVGGVRMLSVDHRVLDNWRELGMTEALRPGV
ncbi:MAG: type II toxin-antitoxin system VapC family toxin [Deltaproteobacteria bacterium]|nr:type II toxin-antitoxin system VapC family toxin [Deltaproteobacteria bacterium]